MKVGFLTPSKYLLDDRHCLACLKPVVWVFPASAETFVVQVLHDMAESAAENLFSG
jgi:hypothetical protein